METETKPKTFEAWCVVEIMGHSRYAGRVSEQSIGGCSFVRIDVPAVEEQPAFTKLFAQGVIFSITPTDEATARRAAAQFRERPLVLWEALPPRRLPNPDDDVY